MPVTTRSQSTKPLVSLEPVNRKGRSKNPNVVYNLLLKDPLQIKSVPKQTDEMRLFAYMLDRNSMDGFTDISPELKIQMMRHNLLHCL